MYSAYFNDHIMLIMWLAHQGGEGMAIQLFSHNMQAYRAVLDMLSRNRKAAVIHPTGTGKSFIAFKWIEEHPLNHFVWLSPSDYIFKTQLENVQRSTPDFPADQILFLTYARLMQMSDAELAELMPDGIVLDEFHRCGAKCWGDGVMRLLSMFKDAQLLGLSATKIRYLDGQRDMAEELFEGCIASEMALGEAIVRGILPAPVYVTTLYRVEQDLAKYQRRIDGIQSGSVRTASQLCMEKLRRALQDAEGLDEIFARHIRHKSGKYLVFCTSESHMQQVRRHVKEWFGQIDPDAHCYSAYSADPLTSRAYQAFVQDESEHLKLLFSINMFNEGVHVPGVSGVILFRPTISPIIYKQQIGRALTAGMQQTPLILDVINNFEGLNSYGTIQAEMDEAVERLVREHHEDEILVRRFTVMEQMQDCVELFNRLEQSLNSTWDHYFEAAAAYYAEHGNLKIPKRYTSRDGLCLGLWIQRQREAQNSQHGSELSRGQIERLSSIGMIWESKTEAAWNTGFEHARQYYQQNSHLDAECTYVCEDGYKLGNWLRRLRQQKNGSMKNTVLTAERTRQLEAIGMRWQVYADGWEAGYQAAAEYYEKNGHLKVAGDYITEDGFSLGHWLSTQRQAKTGSFGRKSLSLEKIERLDKIGMIWETRRERQWNQFYVEAKAYFDQHGNLRIPYQFQTESGLKLGAWVWHQRRQWKSGKTADAEQYCLLERIGMFENTESDAPLFRAI